MADEKPDSKDEQVVPLNDEDAQKLSDRLNDAANPLNTEELGRLDEYYTIQEKNEQEIDESSTQTIEKKEESGEAGSQKTDDDPLEIALVEKKKAEQYAGKQAYELGNTRKDLDTANSKIKELEAAKKGPDKTIKDDTTGEDIDLTNPVELKKYTEKLADNRVQAILEKQQIENKKQTDLVAKEQQNYQRGKENLESIQKDFQGQFDTKEPISEIFDKIQKGQYVDPQDGKIAEKVMFINDYGRKKSIYDLSVAYREWMREKGIKDPLSQKAEEKGREQLANDIEEKENKNPTLTNVVPEPGKKISTIDDLDKNPDFQTAIDKMSVDEVRELEEEIMNDPKYSITGQQ